METTASASPRPAIVLVSATLADQLADHFWRYSREYDLHEARSSAEAQEISLDVLAKGSTVALYVSDSQLPDDDVLEAFGQWRSLIPTARRMIAPPYDRFLADGPGLRHGLAEGQYDAYVLMPRGARDEEFHHAVTELLSDWGATAVMPEVVAATIVADAQDSLVWSIRDYLDRMGFPNRTCSVDSPEGAEIVAHLEGGVGSPVVSLLDHAPFVATGVRDVAVALYGVPNAINVPEVVDLVIGPYPRILDTGCDYAAGCSVAAWPVS